jgi:hypothetical protein
MKLQTIAKKVGWLAKLRVEHARTTPGVPLYI